MKVTIKSWFSYCKSASKRQKRGSNSLVSHFPHGMASVEGQADRVGWVLTKRGKPGVEKYTVRVEKSSSGGTLLRRLWWRLLG